MSSLKYLPLISTESHPEDPLFLHDLADECFKRYGLSGEKDDLDKLILRLSKKSSPPLAESGSDYAQTLLDLALALIHRFKNFRSKPPKFLTMQLQCILSSCWPRR
jgi:hypothetical protein